MQLKRIRWKRGLLCVILFAFLIGSLGTVLATVSIVQYSKLDEKTPCDAAIVLGAATINGEVSPVYRERLNHGIRLYENGYVDYLIMTGGERFGGIRRKAIRNFQRRSRRSHSD